jgi:hypothetical protein
MKTQLYQGRCRPKSRTATENRNNSKIDLTCSSDRDNKSKNDPKSAAGTGTIKTSRASATGARIGPYLLGKTLGIGSTGIIIVAINY